jgi:predicted nucleic acid-binding protein
LRIEVDTEGMAKAWSASVQLAEKHGLTVYDAAYLELAQRRRLKIATIDNALFEAARIELLPATGL